MIESNLFIPRLLLLLLSTNTFFCCAQSDTIVGSKTYSYVKKDLNHRVLEMGEWFNGGIKNGEWKRFDSQGRPLSIEQYRQDTITGIAVYFYYPNPGKFQKETGWMEGGKRISIWSTFECKTYQDPGKVVLYTIYGNNEQVTAKLILHNNGRIAIETIMDTSGRPCWYRKFDRSGKLLFEGAELPYFPE